MPDDEQVPAAALDLGKGNAPMHLGRHDQDMPSEWQAGRQRLMLRLHATLGDKNFCIGWARCQLLCCGSAEGRSFVGGPGQHCRTCRPGSSRCSLSSAGRRTRVFCRMRTSSFCTQQLCCQRWQAT